MSATVCAETRRDVVHVGGADAETFLQGQCSQDVATIPAGGAAWTFVLAPTGKVESFGRVARVDGGFAIDTDAGFGSGLEKRLARFRLRVDVELRLDEDVPCLACRGPDARTIPGLPSWWNSRDAVDVLGPGGSLPDGVVRVGAEELERLRIGAGWPALGSELGPDTIPGETPLVPIAVSFTKGCYTGQELVARIDSRGGNVPRHLRRLRFAEPVAPGTRLHDADRDVGWVTSAAGTDGLGYVARAVAVPGEVRAGDVAVRVEPILAGS